MGRLWGVHCTLKQCRWLAIWQTPAALNCEYENVEANGKNIMALSRHNRQITLTQFTQWHLVRIYWGKLLDFIPFHKQNQLGLQIWQTDSLEGNFVYWVSNIKTYIYDKVKKIQLLYSSVSFQREEVVFLKLVHFYCCSLIGWWISMSHLLRGGLGEH